MTAPQRVEERRRSFIRLMGLVARRDYLRTVRRRGFIFATALLPIAMAGLLALSSLMAPTFEPAPPASLTVVNESTLELVVPAGAEVRVIDRSAATADLESGRLAEFYVIPAGYPADAQVQRLLAGGRAPGVDELQRWSGHEQALAATLRLSLLSDAGLPGDIAERIVRPLAITDIGLDDTPGGPGPGPGPGLGLVLPYALTFLFVMSIFITSGYLLQSVTEEKENRVVEIVLSSVPPQSLMAGKILGLGAAGLTQVAIWVTTALVALPILAERMPALQSLAIDPALLVVGLAFFVLGYLAYGAIFAAIGAIAPGTREAQQYSGFFGFLAVVPLVFAGAFFVDPGSPLVIALALIPLTAPAAMLQLLGIAPQTPWLLVAASLASLGIFALIAGLAASRIFRATLLLYGARPSLRNIIAAVTARG